jgi:hypothetical protein
MIFTASLAMIDQMTDVSSFCHFFFLFRFYLNYNSIEILDEGELYATHV